MTRTILVQGDDESVRPRIGNMQLELEEGDLWAFFASDYVHGTNVIKGDKARIVYQFGFVVPADYPLATANGVFWSTISGHLYLRQFIFNRRHISIGSV